MGAYSSRRMYRRTALCAALCLGLGVYVAPTYAANNDGTVVGRTAAGATVTIKDPSTGFTRTVTADDKGNYRIPYLPVGKYTIESAKDGKSTSQPTEVTVSLGNATTVNLGVKELEGVTVSATSVITAVDVTSTEIATNLSREELRRLPVDQNVAAVALLAPGVVKGAAGFGGISFGGSSVAENAVYVNGLNVTDFYNRNGFSEAPYNFYQEFQVKTGGYSVEFGRTTGGVINAVARSGNNEFHYGAELTMTPGNWQSRAEDRYYSDGTRYITASYDRDSAMKTNVYASGPIVKDKLFFFAMYEARGDSPRNTDNDGTTLTSNSSNPGFWGTTIDWHLNDTNIFQLMAFSDKAKNTGTVYNFNYDTGKIGNKTNEVYTDNGGKNWALTYTSYLTNDLSAKLMYGTNKRESFNRSLTDLDCNRVATDGKIARPPNDLRLGCTTNSSVNKRNDERKQYRADFEWKLGDHLVRFGYDHEQNDSDYSSYYTGPGAIYYNVYIAKPGDTITNPSGTGIVPPGYFGYVRARRYEVSGTFETTNSAFYLEDNWQITPNFLINAGIRNDGFDNKDAAGKSYIKMDNMWAPRFGFSWDMKGDGTTKLYGNLGRYYLPVANVINIKQAGGLLDQRTYYAFGGWQTLTDKAGNEYAMPILGPQLGGVDVSQGNGTVGDLRSEVDRNMDQVYQDEVILGFEQAINDKWSWGVNGTYRRLHNAIDDMEISATGKCGEAGYVGWVMANPGSKVTVWGDTDCNGTMGWVTVDTAKEGWAMYRTDVDANGDTHDVYIGQRGWVKPKRTYSALEFQLDRAWDNKWSFNASYVLSWNRGNAEGPVNSDTDFADTGRTENFDNPWVNYGGDGYLPNDRRHQFKFRGTYAITPNWEVSGDLNIQSGAPVTGFGVGDPYDNTAYHSYYICTQRCGTHEVPDPADPSQTIEIPYPSAERVYVNSPRGKYGRTPWIYNLNAGIAYIRPLGDKGQLRVKLSVYNLLNQQRAVNVDQDLQTTIGDGTSSSFGSGIIFQQPRFTQLTVSVDF